MQLCVRQNPRHYRALEVKLPDDSIKEDILFLLSFSLALEFRLICCIMPEHFESHNSDVFSVIDTKLL